MSNTSDMTKQLKQRETFDVAQHEGVDKMIVVRGEDGNYSCWRHLSLDILFPDALAVF